MNVTAQKFQSQKSCRLNRKPQATIEGHSLSHALRACQLPQRGSRETFPFIVPPGNHDVTGDFHRPYETQNV